MGRRKLPSETVEHLRSAISALDTPERRARYQSGQFPRADSVKDLDKRYRWDLMWESGAHKKVYEQHGGRDLKDAHIDTALRSVVSPLTPPSTFNDRRTTTQRGTDKVSKDLSNMLFGPRKKK